MSVDGYDDSFESAPPTDTELSGYVSYASRSQRARRTPNASVSLSSPSPLRRSVVLVDDSQGYGQDSFASPPRSEAGADEPTAPLGDEDHDAGVETTQGQSYFNDSFESESAPTAADATQGQSYFNDSFESESAPAAADATQGQSYFNDSFESESEAAPAVPEPATPPKRVLRPVETGTTRFAAMLIKKLQQNAHVPAVRPSALASTMVDRSLVDRVRQGRTASPSSTASTSPLRKPCPQTLLSRARLHHLQVIGTSERVDADETLDDILPPPSSQPTVARFANWAIQRLKEGDQLHYLSQVQSDPTHPQHLYTDPLAAVGAAASAMRRETAELAALGDQAVSHASGTKPYLDAFVQQQLAQSRQVKKTFIEKFGDVGRSPPRPADAGASTSNLLQESRALRAQCVEKLHAPVAVLYARRAADPEQCVGTTEPETTEQPRSSLSAQQVIARPDLAEEWYLNQAAAIKDSIEADMAEMEAEIRATRHALVAAVQSTQLPLLQSDLRPSSWQEIGSAESPVHNLQSWDGSMPGQSLPQASDTDVAVMLERSRMLRSQSLIGTRARLTHALLTVPPSIPSSLISSDTDSLLDRAHNFAQHVCEAQLRGK